MILDFDKIKKAHFVGVGGVSMSKLCSYCLSLGIECSGSDRVWSDVLQKLKDMGANVYCGENAEIAKQSDVVVYTAAIAPDNSELSVVNKIERKYFLAQIANNFQKSIAVSGAHGKTTVCGMVAWVLMLAREKLTFHIGGDVCGLENLKVHCGDEIFLTEACEYARSFLTLNPSIGVILNIDYDHPDCYDSLDDTIDAFNIFANNSSQIVAHESALQYLKCEREIISYGEDAHCDYFLSQVEYMNGKYFFDVYKQGNFFGSFEICSCNRINVICALATITICDIVGLPQKLVAKALASFVGIKKRFECLGLANSGARVIFDYAHHPKEISTVITNARKLVKGRLITLFQPHTYSRTQALMEEFINCFDNTDLLYILPTYSARELPPQGATAYELYSNLITKKIDVKYLNGYEDAVKTLKQNSDKEDIILLLGAGLEGYELYNKISN